MIAANDDPARETALLRGTLDLCVMSILSRRPTHAYNVVAQLQAAGFGTVTYGTIYPLTMRLRRVGLLAQRSEPSTAGPNRNLLTLTDDGETALVTWGRQWDAHSRRVATVLESDRELRSRSLEDSSR